MPLINCKVELKLRWAKHCVLSVTSSDNANGDNDDNKIRFTIKGTKLLVRGNQKLSKLLSKGFERSVYWNEHKTKSDNESTTIEFRFLLLKYLKVKDIIYQN